MIERIRTVSLALPCAILLSFLFVACGDDSSSASSKEESFAAKKFASIEELPTCTSDQYGMLADVAGDYYACVAGGWILVDKVVAGVCNIPACDGDGEGLSVYSVSDSRVYRCFSNTWKGLDGKSFSEDDFIGCFLDAVVQDSVASVEFLKNCNSASEGSLSVVGKNLVSCASHEWVDIMDKVISEGDLPKCVENGSYVYVLSKVSAYECKNGVWYKGGEAISSSSTPAASSSSQKTESSSSGDKKSSSSDKPGSSSSAKSSSSPVSSTTVPEDDGTKVRGVCMASVREAVKGDEVTYTFYNLGGTPLTFNWIFGEDGSPENSTRVSPTVKFGKGGMFNAKLVVNEGRESASDTIVCTGVKVSGVPVTGCSCVPEQTAMVLAGDAEIMPVEWNVTGCSGAGPFKYEWGDTPIRLDSFSTWLPPGLGSFAPTLTVYNSDGETMEPVCKPVAVTTPMTFGCSVNSSQFTVSYVSGANASLSSIEVKLVSDEGMSEYVTLLPTSSYQSYNYAEDKNYTRYSWSTNRSNASILLPDSSLPWTTYAAVYAGDTVCRATRAVCGPVEGTSSNFLKGDTSLWSIRVDGTQYFPEFSEWTINLPDSTTITGSVPTVKVPLTSVGTVSGSLKVSDGKNTKTLACSDMVVNPNVSGCACNGPILKSDNFNVADYVPVYGWYVDGCESDGEKLTYEWFGYYNSEFSLYNNDSAGWAYFYNVGPYAPTVKVSNTYGASQDLTCPEAEAVYLRCWTDSISVQMGDTVKWYYSLDGSIKNPTFYWEFREDDGDTITSTDEFPKWVYSDLKTIYTSLTLNRGLLDEVTVNCGWVSPRPRPVTGCTCGEPELLSESYNFEENVVKYRWHVTGCDANGATPLKYTWDDYFVPLESDSTVVEYSYTQYYSLSPFVTITNADGMIQNMYCESAKLMQASCKPDRDTAEVGESVVWNWTFNTSVDFGGIKTFLWTFTNGDGVVSTSSNGTHMEQHQVVGNVSATLELNKNLVDDYLINCSPLYVKPKVKRTCACEYDVSPGKGQGSIVSWTVSDCGGTAPYTYEWSNDVTPDPENPETASATFPEPGTYWPTVAVTDANGMELSVVCPKVNVEISGED